MPNQVQTRRAGGGTVYTLRDEATGATASVLPGVGFNLFDLRLPAGPGGEVRPVVATRPGWEDEPDVPSRQGIPVLFPFPNRIRDGRFAFEGRDYRLTPNKGPNAIHGFALEAPWEVVAAEATGASARIVGRFRLSAQAPGERENWPSDAQVELTYTLSGRRLTLDAVVSNEGEAAMPWGFGIHPYFRLPIDPAGDRARTRVVLPASEYWVLEGSLPTGERRPVDAARDFRRGRPIAGLEVDDVFTGLDFDGGLCTCRLVDEDLGAEFRVAFGREFRELVAFTPPFLDGGVLAVEPYTMATDAVNLQPKGVDAGLRVLAPGESSRLRVVMETADLAG